MDTLDLGSWFILRMASSDTLRVKDALCRSGLNVWTPTEQTVKRATRSRTRAEHTRPLLPTYAFADVADLDDIMRLAMIPRLDVPRFSVFHQQGGIPLLTDAALDGLRKEEARCLSVFQKLWRKGTKAARFDVGSEVKIIEGAGQGMTGTVTGGNGQFSDVTFMLFGRTSTLKVSSLLLQPVGIRAADAVNKAA